MTKWYNKMISFEHVSFLFFGIAWVLCVMELFLDPYFFLIKFNPFSVGLMILCLFIPFAFLIRNLILKKLLPEPEYKKKMHNCKYCDHPMLQYSYYKDDEKYLYCTKCKMPFSLMQSLNELIEGVEVEKHDPELMYGTFSDAGETAVATVPPPPQPEIIFFDLADIIRDDSPRRAYTDEELEKMWATVEEEKE